LIPERFVMITRTYDFSCQKVCRSHRIEGLELWTLTVQARDLPLGFKYGPNARFAELKTKAAKEMLGTLESNPASFIFKNNGMMVVAESIKSEGTEVSLVCNESEPDDDAPGHGVLNGGHTYKVLQHAIESKDPKFRNVGEQAFVTLTVGIGIPEDEIWRISRARNTSEKVPLHALRELAGDWSIVKDHLPANLRHLVAFKPNDPEAPNEFYDTTDLIRRLALINNKMFPAEQGSHPVQAYTSIGTVVRKYTESSFAEVAPLLPDVLRLEELIVRHWEELNGRGGDRIGISKASGCSAEPCQLLSGYTAHITLADPFVLPVLAAFRVFVVGGRWVVPMDDLWEKYGPKTVRALWEAYKDIGKSSAAVFGRSKGSWTAACDLTKSAAIQMGLIQVV
jgi:hypothetical protein